MLSLTGAVIGLMAVVPAAHGEWPLTGETVRVTTYTGRTSVKGILMDADGAVLTVSLGSGKPPVRIPLASVERLEVARGRRATVKEGAIVGGLAGATLGIAAMTSLGYALCEGATSCGTSREGYLIGAGILGAVGAGVGALAGHAIKTDRWQRVPIDRVRLGIRPMAKGVGVQLRLQW